MDQEDIDRFEKKNLWWVALIAIVIAIVGRSYFYSSLSSGSSSKECSGGEQSAVSEKHVGQGEAANEKSKC